MKNSIIILIGFISFFLFNSSFAQEIKTGVYRVSGSIGLSFISQKEGNHNQSGTDFQAGCSINYLVTNNLELGGILSYYYSESTYESSYFGSYKSTSFFSAFSIGPGIRFYLTSQGIIPFIEASAQYSVNGYQGGMQNEQATYAGGVGFDYFLSGGLALEPFINYSHFVYKEGSRNTLFFGARINYFIF